MKNFVITTLLSTLCLSTAYSNQTDDHNYDTDAPICSTYIVSMISEDLAKVASRYSFRGHQPTFRTEVTVKNSSFFTVLTTVTTKTGSKKFETIVSNHHGDCQVLAFGIVK